MHSNIWLLPCQAKYGIKVVDFTPKEVDNMNNNEKSSQANTLARYQAAWNNGTEIGHDANISRQEQRIKLARRLKALRMERGFSQEQLSDAINANYLTYKGYENCKSDIPLFYLVRKSSEYSRAFAISLLCSLSLFFVPAVKISSIIFSSSAK